MKSRDAARFRATAGVSQGFGKTPQDALFALLERLPGPDFTPIVILPYNQGDAFFSEAQQRRLQELKSRPETLTTEERSELDELIATAFDATIERTNGLPSLKK